MSARPLEGLGSRLQPTTLWNLAGTFACLTSGTVIPLSQCLVADLPLCASVCAPVKWVPTVAGSAACRAWNKFPHVAGLGGSRQVPMPGVASAQLSQQHLCPGPPNDRWTDKLQVWAVLADP